MFAHKKKRNGKLIYETIEDHSLLTVSYYNKLKDNRIQEILFDNGFDVTYLDKYLESMCMLHDVGKYNHLFQINKMDNTLESFEDGNSNHSIKGAIYFYFYNKNIIDDLNLTNHERREQYTLLYLIAFVIAKHHSKLSNLEDFNSSLERFSEEELNQMIELPHFDNNDFPIRHLKQMNGIALKVVNKGNQQIVSAIRLIRGLLSLCDRLATSQFMNDNIINLDRISKEQIILSEEKYKESSHYKSSLIKYDDLDSIQALRNAFVIEMDSNIKDLLTIDTINAPTGVGKTHLSLRYSLSKMKEGRKVLYCTQFNNVSEQTFGYYDSILTTKDKDLKVSLNNSITSIYHLEGDKYDESLMRYQLLEYHYALTSNQRLLNTLFSDKIEDAMAYYLLKDSIIIIDELQNVRHENWNMLVQELQTLAKYFNSNILLMSATLPNFSKISKVEFNELIRNKELIDSPLLKDRIVYSSKLFTENSIRSDSFYEDIIDEMFCYKDKRILIEFITKKDSIKFYKRLVNRLQEDKRTTKVFLMNGDSNSLERKEIIDEITEMENGKYRLKDFILVSTQVIEAGLDIDCEIGFKDSSSYDSEVQFAGRVNRNGLFDKGLIYLFNKEKEDVVYNEYKTHKIKDSYYDNVVNGNYDLYFNELIEIINAEEDSLLTLFNKLKLSEISELVKFENNQTDVFITDREYEGKLSIDYYKEFIELKHSNMDYAEKQIKLSSYRKTLSLFIKKTYNKGVSELLESGETFVFLEENKYKKLLNSL